MLQVRTRRPGWAVATIGASLLALFDRWAASDPGLVRLTLAARGTLSVTLAAVAAMVAAHLFQVAPTDFASGVTLSMMGPFLMREPTLRQRRRTLLLLTLPAAGAALVTALLHGRGAAGDSCFLALVFVGYLFHPRSPRMIGIGLVAVVTTYVGLYLELPPQTLPLQLAAVLAAAPIIAFACFVALPMNPAATLRRTVKAVQWRAAQVLRRARLVAADGRGPGASRHLLRELVRLNEAALAADDLLALIEPGGRDALRTGLIDLELATSRLIDRLRDETPDPRHAHRLRLHERRIRRGRAYALSRSQVEDGSLLANLVELGGIVHRLGLAARETSPIRRAAGPAPLPPGPLAWQLATKVTLAAALAMAGGMALSPNRWFWAVITVYVVFLNTRSRGDTIYKGLQRVGGTLLGITSGLLLALLLADRDVWQVGALLVAIFGMYYFFLVSYTLGIFCVTVMLGLLYGVLGAPLESVLVLRLEETAIGAAAGILVAAFVFPTRTRDHVMRSGQNVLLALAEAVRVSRQAMTGSLDASPTAAMRRVDRQVAELRLALAPLTAGRALLRRSGLERSVPALLDCVHGTRVLAAAAGDRGAPDRTASAETALADTTLAVQRAVRIEERLTRLAGTATDGHSTPVDASGPGAQACPVVDGRLDAALTSLDAAVGILTKRIKVGVIEGFALDG